MRYVFIYPAKGIGQMDVNTTENHLQESPKAYTPSGYKSHSAYIHRVWQPCAKAYYPFGVWIAGIVWCGIFPHTYYQKTLHWRHWVWQPCATDVRALPWMDGANSLNGLCNGGSRPPIGLWMDTQILWMDYVDVSCALLYLHPLGDYLVFRGVFLFFCWFLVFGLNLTFVRISKGYMWERKH